MHIQCPRYKGTGDHNGFQCVLCDGRGYYEKGLEVINIQTIRDKLFSIQEAAEWCGKILFHPMREGETKQFDNEEFYITIASKRKETTSY
jgi:hypothetical protein